MERCWRRWRRASLFRRHGGRALRLFPEESRQREKLWFAGLFSGAGLLLILLI